MESELAGPRVPPALAGCAQTPTGRLLASGSLYLPRLPGGVCAARVSALRRGPPVACVAFVSGYSCGAATVSHRVPGLIGPCPPAELQTQGAGTTEKRIPSGACADGSHTHSPPSREIRTPVSWLPGRPTCRAFPRVWRMIVSHIHAAHIPSGGCGFRRWLQLRGSAGFSPASRTGRCLSPGLVLPGHTTTGVWASQ